MKAKILMATITLLLSTGASLAETLPTPSCMVVDCIPFYYPVNHNIIFHFSYPHPLAIKEDAKAYIYHQDEIVAACGIRINDNTFRTKSIFLDSDVDILPKGRMYTVQIPEGCIYDADDPTIYNETVSCGFCVPSYIADIWSMPQEGANLSMETKLQFNQVIKLQNSRVEIYRDGTFVKEMPFNNKGDYVFGEVVFVTDGIGFEDGVPYTLVIPEGCIWISGGADMANPEIAINLTGSIVDPYPKVDYVDVEKIFDPETNVLSKVIFYYDQPIMVVESGNSVQLLDGNNIVAQADIGYNYSNEPYSYYGEDDGIWMLIADFSNISDKLEPGKDYDAVPTDGAVYAVTDIHGGSSVQSVASEKQVLLGCTDGILTVKNAAHGSRISAYTVDGRMAGSTVADGTATATLPLPVKGLYIVTVGQRSYKVMNR